MGTLTRITLLLISCMLILGTLFFGEALSQVLALALLPTFLLLMIDLKGKDNDYI